MWRPLRRGGGVTTVCIKKCKTVNGEWTLTEYKDLANLARILSLQGQHNKAIELMEMSFQGAKELLRGTDIVTSGNAN